MEKQVLRFYGFKFIVCNIYRFVQAILSLIPLLEQVSFRAVFLIIYLFILTFFVVVRVDLAVPFYLSFQIKFVLLLIVNYTIFMMLVQRI